MAAIDKEWKYVYPKIPKEYVKPVMFACSIIRKEKTFNKAIAVASNYYGVDPNVLKEHIVKRTQAGSKYSRKLKAEV